MRRAEGQKIPTDIIKQLNLQKNDIIILQYYPANRFSKYFDFSDYKVIEITKGNFTDYLSAGTTYSDAFRNGKDLYKHMFLSEQNTYFESMLKKNILNDLKTGQNVVIVTLNSVAFYSPEQLKQIATDSHAYLKTPLLFLVFLHHFSFVHSPTSNVNKRIKIKICPCGHIFL